MNAQARKTRMAKQLKRRNRATHGKRAHATPHFSAPADAPPALRDASARLAAYGKILSRLSPLSHYAAASVLMLVVCYALNYAGNQIPYELTQQRFAATFDSAGKMTKTGIDFNSEQVSWHEYCIASGMVLVGAHGGGNAAVDAVLLKHPDIAHGGHCGAVWAAVTGAEPQSVRAKFRYRWGGKTLYAIALRWFSVTQFHALVRGATYFAYLLLAGALLLIGWRALAVAAPLLALGPFFSGIPHYADAINGVAYLWAVLAAAALALLLAKPGSANWKRAKPFCFFAGMVSAYLWMWEGHNFLATALIGMVAWLGYAHLSARQQTRAAIVCVALYIAGFVVLFALDQLVKWGLHEWVLDTDSPLYARGVDDTFTGAGGVLGDLFTAIQMRLQEVMQQQTDPQHLRARFRKINSVETFFPFLTIASVQFSKALLFSAALALTGALAVAFHRARRGWHEFPYGVLWFVALALAFSVHFLLPDDLYPRSARYAFTPLALAWSCLLYALLSTQPLRTPPQTAPRQRSRKPKRRRGR